MSTGGRSEPLLVLGLAAVAAAFVVLGHGRWLDPIIDAGRDLYVPEQLARGARLYRDLDYNYPPLAPYALALAVRLFGSSLALYQAIGGALAAVAAAAMYLLGRAVAGVAGAVTSALLFIALCVAGRPNFNFFFPYAHAMTFGAALLVVYLLLLLRRSDWALLPGALACAAKIDFALPVIACALVQRRWKSAALFAVVTVATARFPSQLAGGAAADFYRRLLVGDWRELILGAVLIAGAAVLAMRPNRVMVAAVFVAFCFVSADTLFAPAPLVHLAAVPFLRRDKELPLLWCASITSTARIALNVSPTYNGFAYVLPTILLFVYLATTFDSAVIPSVARDLGEGAAHRTKDLRATQPPRSLATLGMTRARGRVVWLAVFAGVAAHALWLQVERARTPAVRVETPRGAYLDPNASRAAAMSGALEFLRAAPPGTLAVVPEGVSINYFSGRGTPLRRYLFTPPESGAPHVEEEVLRDWQAHPPDFVAVTNRAVGEYGSRGFGVDYDQRLAALIARDYVPVASWGRELRLLRRKR